MVRNNRNASAKTLDVAGVVDPGYSLYSGLRSTLRYISALTHQKSAAINPRHKF